jgi:hypothetical protein
MRSRLAIFATALYLLIFACALAYPLFDHSTFAGLFSVLLALPWIDYLPSGWLPAAVALNAVIIYLVSLAISLAITMSARRDQAGEKRKNTNSVSS